MATGILPKPTCLTVFAASPRRTAATTLSSFSSTLLRENAEIVYKLEPNRKYWLHAARGSLILNGQIMVAGDGMAVEDENATLQLRGVDAESDFLLFNLPK